MFSPGRLLNFPLLLAFATGAPAQKKGAPPVPLVELMPPRPEHWRVVDWKQRALEFDRLAFDESAQGPYLPLLTWGDASKARILIPSYVGAGRGGEGICALAAVMSGTLAGVNKANDRGHNWPLLSEAWFSDRAHVVMNNIGAHNQGGSFWYLVLPGVLFSQLALHYPEVDGLGEKLHAMADRYREVVVTLGGARADFNYTGFDFDQNAPLDNGRWKEPDAAAGIAYIEYAAWTRWRDPRHLETVRWCLDFLERRAPAEGNPLYETLLYYAPALAAKFNAEHGAHYDVAKLLNWCLSDNGQRGTTRPAWGILARRFGDQDVYGLQGSTRAGEGYAFAMNTFNAAAALAPLARYDERFAAPLAKWLTHVANNARLFFPDEIAADSQSCPTLADTVLKAVPYEGLREKAIVRAEWKLGTIHPGTADADAEAKLHGNPKWSQTKFQCDGEGRLSILLEVSWPANGIAGSWHIDARVAPGAALFRLASAARPEGPWRDCGGFAGRGIRAGASGEVAAGGPLPATEGARTVWLKIEAAGQHEPGEALTIRALRLFTTLRTSPWASGDCFTNGHGPTDLAPYGGAYLGYLAALVKRTEHERVLAFDLRAVDFLSTEPTGCLLYYNADEEPHIVAQAAAPPVPVPAGAEALIHTARRAQ